MMRPTRMLHDDRGAALPLVLGFVVLVSAITVALLGQAAANMRNTRVAKDHQTKVYATSSALDWAIQQLRSDPTICPTEGSSGTLTYPSSDSRVHVTIECTATEGGAVGAAGWSVFTTGGAGVTIETQSGAGSGAKRIAGPVYNSGGWDLSADLTVADGFVRQASSGSGCPAQPSRLRSDPGGRAGFYSCGPSIPTPAPVRSVDELVSGASFDLNPPYETIGACRVFSPGRYTVAPELSGGTNYFRPGVYVLDNVEMPIARQGASVPVAIAGVPTEGPLPSALNGCPGVAPVRNGVVFLLGGRGAISVDRAHLEIHPYYPNGPDGRPTQSIYQLQSPLSDVVTDVPTGHVALRTSNGQGQELIVHGNVHVASSAVVLTGTGIGHDIQLLGGVVSRSLTIQASANINSFQIAHTDDASARVVDIAVEVTLRNGADLPIGRPVRGVATVFIRNDAARTTSLSAWRINEDLTSPSPASNP